MLSFLFFFVLFLVKIGEIEKMKKCRNIILSMLFIITSICQIKRDKTFHLRNSKKLLMVFGNLVIF